MSISRCLGLIGFEQLTESYNNIIKGSDFTFNIQHGTFTHIHYDSLDDAKELTVKSYQTLGKMISRAKLLNDVELSNRALDYNYEKYDITELVILINILFNRIDTYNLCNKMGVNMDLEYDYLPFSNPTLEELQLLLLEAIESFTIKSMKKI